MNRFEYCYLTTGGSYEDLYTLKLKGQSFAITGKLLSDILDKLGKEDSEMVGFDSREGKKFIFSRRELRMMIADILEVRDNYYWIWIF